tara:strand:+ start:2565 stop:2903 length:339 start_codon:yes stop_codon:yes gene_type:complete
MRYKLKKYIGQRLCFSATVEKFGEKTAFKGAPIPTLLLKDIRIKDQKEILSDHLWFTKGKSWKNVSEGDTVEFFARVSTYEKGYKGYRDDVFDAPIRKDFRLERPSKVKIIN